MEVKLEKWKPSRERHPDCTCEYTLSIFCAILVSSRLPAKMLPGVHCPCGKTFFRYKDKQLFVKG